MAEKWTEKEVLQHAKELKSPFEDKQAGPGNGILAGMAEKVNQILGKNKGNKP